MKHPTMVAFQENVKTKTCHPKNEYFTHENVVLMIPFNLLRDKKPDVSDAKKFLPTLKEINTDLLDWKLIKIDQSFEIMSFFWNTIVNELKSTVIEETIVQLLNDLNSKSPDSLTDIKTSQDAHNWHDSVEGSVKDEIAWNSMHPQFDQKQHSLNLIKEMNENCGVDCEEKSKRGCVE